MKIISIILIIFLNLHAAWTEANQVSQIGIATSINSSAEKTIPENGDFIGVLDSNSSFSLKKISLSNLKSFLFASPVLSGLPTAANGTSTTQIATTAFVMANSSGGASGIVVGQTWINANRANGTTYTNTTGKPIFVMIGFTGIDYTIGVGTISIGAINISITGSPGQHSYTSFIVPNNTTYSVSVDTTYVSIVGWYELR